MELNRRDVLIGSVALMGAATVGRGIFAAQGQLGPNAKVVESGSTGVPIEEGRVPFRQYKVWYRKVGECKGPGKLPLLCLHGGPGMSHDYLEPLEKIGNSGRQVIFYDQLGSGDSDHPSDEEMWKVNLFVEELGAMRRSLGLENVHILGHSWGGMLAMEYALTKPPGLASLIIADSPASIPQYQIEVNRLRAQLPAYAQRILSQHEKDNTTDHLAYRYVELMVFGHQHACRLRITPWCVWRTLWKFMKFTSVNSIQYPEVYRIMIGQSDLNVTGNLKRWSIVDRLGEIHVPTLVLSGQYDEVTPELTKTVHLRIPGSVRVLFENSAHLPHLEETDRYLQVVTKFLDDVESRGSLPSSPPTSEPSR